MEYYPHLVRRVKCAKSGIVFVGCWDYLDRGLWGGIFNYWCWGVELKFVARLLGGLDWMIESWKGCVWEDGGDGGLV